jgi:outer membrane protein TolC
MKHLFFLIPAMAVFSVSLAQTPVSTPAKYNIPLELRKATYDTIGEALVSMAMDNPQIMSAQDVSDEFKANYAHSKTLWLNNLVLQGNLNEFSIKRNNSSDPLKQSTQYPRWNIGLLVPVGIFVNSKKQVRTDYYRWRSTVDNVDVAKRDVREQTLTAYQDYQMNKKLLDLHVEVLHDIQIIYLKSEEKFTRGELSLDAFTSNSRAYNDEMTRQITLESAFKVASNKLESLIGLNIEQALYLISSGKYKKIQQQKQRQEMEQQLNK